MADAKKPAAPANKEAAKTKDESPREKFERVGGVRVANALDKIDLVGQICDARRYEYTANDVEQAIAAMRGHVNKAEQRMKDGLAKKEKSGKEKTAFKFGGE